MISIRRIHPLLVALCLVLLVAACAQPAFLGGGLGDADLGEWAMEGRNLSRNRASDESVAPPLTLEKTFHVGGDTSFASPIGVAHGRLFVDGERQLQVIDQQNGEEVWRFRLAGSYTSPAVAGDNVFIRAESGEEGFIFALTAETGAKLWEFRFPKVGSPYDNIGGHVTSPVVAQGQVLVGAAQSLYALDVESGEPVWEFRLQSPIGSSAAVADDLVFVSDFTTLYAVKLTSGEEAWRYDFGGVSLFFAPIVADDQVLIASSDTAFSLDRRTGALRWARQIPGEELIPAAADDSLMYIKSANRLFALDRASGALRWRYETVNFVSVPALAGDQLYVVTRFPGGSQLRALNRETGAELWVSDDQNLARSAPVVAGGRVYVRTEAGDILVYRS